MSITDLYIKLFGKGAIQDGSVIDMAEHGRTGGVSTGQGHKFIKNPEEQVQIDAADSTTTYIGVAKIAGATSSPIWQIKRILVSGNVTSFAYADGDANYDNIWDNRASFVYS